MNNASDELIDLRRAFDTYDRNGDGAINSAEFQELLNALDQDLSEDECLLAFEATDADGDGVINFEEFKSWWTDQ